MLPAWEPGAQRPRVLAGAAGCPSEAAQTEGGRPGQRPPPPSVLRAVAGFPLTRWSPQSKRTNQGARRLGALCRKRVRSVSNGS